MIQELSKEKAKKLSKLKQKKYRNQEGYVLVEGSRSIRQIIDDGIEIAELFYTVADEKKYEDIVSIVPENRCYRSPDDRIDRLSATASPQTIIALVPAVKREVQSFNRLLLLDGIADPNNLGTIIRTASAFGIDGIIITKEGCDIFNSLTVRASVGKVFSMPFSDIEDFDFKSFPGEIIIADTGGNQPVYELTGFDKPYILVLGSEARGVSSEIQALATLSVFIPMKNRLESLNVAAAAAILMYQLSK